MRRPPKPVPGQRCPATRTAKAYDPKVKTVPAYGKWERRGLRDCPRCGAKDVPMTQSIQYLSGAPMGAWHYAPHTVPEKDQP